MAWEYKIVQGPKERHLNRIITEEELARFDRQGWELVTAFSTQRGIVGKGSGDNELIYYIFRRAKKRESQPAK
jgi:hypothetical protein